MSRLETLIQEALGGLIARDGRPFTPRAISIETVSLEVPELISDAQLADTVASVAHEVMIDERDR